MIAQALAHFPLPWLTCAALLIFFTVFMVASLRALVGTSAKALEQASRLPLEDE